MQRSTAQRSTVDTVDLVEAGTVEAGTVDTSTVETAETVVVHVALRPRRGASRKCLAALASLAAAHPAVPVTVTGLSKDERSVKITVGVDLGLRTAVAKFSPEAQAAYAFVSELFTALYDHMPVYVGEPSIAERAAAAALLEPAAPAVVPAPRSASRAERVPA